MKYRNRWWQRLIPIMLAIVLTMIGLALPVGTKVTADKGYVSFSLTTASALEIPVQAQPSQSLSDISDPTLDIKFEPSGTHIDNDGNLKIRLDFYPTEESKSWSQYYIEVVDETSKEYLAGYQGKLDKDGQPVDQDDYNKWLESLPKVWTITPCLCHFITVKPDITQAELDSLIKSLFPGNVTATIDDASIQENYAHLISPYMRDKSSATSTKMWDDSAKMTPILSEMQTKGLITTSEASSLQTAKSNPLTKTKVDDYVVSEINTRLSDFSVGGESGGTKEDIKPGSIDVGPGATDRSSLIGLSGSGETYTKVVKDNPANATGNLDTFEIWMFWSETTDMYGGTFSASSGNVLTTRDSASFGNVTFGSKQTFTGLTISVHSGDYLGICNKYTTEAYIEGDATGFAGMWVYIGDSIDPADSNTFINDVYQQTNTISIYATGTESGGATAPTVVTGAASSITDTTALCSSNVTATGGANVTAWGTFYGTTTSYGSNVTNTGSNNVSFGWSDTLSSLSANTTYYYMAFATNSAGSANGTSANFTTGYVNYSANQTTYNFGVVQPSSTTNTSGTWILFTNTSSISTNISVKMLASTWTSAGTGWTHSDSAAGANTVAMKANSSNSTAWSSSVFITYNAPYSVIASNVAANSNVATGLSLLAPTSFADGKSDNNTIRFSFFSSS